LDFLITSLRKIGLSLNEAKAFLHLLKKSAITGYELSKSAGIPPSKIYDSLNKLLAKGFISVVETDNGQRYVASEPIEILERHENEYNYNLDQLKRQLLKIRQNPQPFNQYLWHLNERENILRKIKEIIGNSRKLIYLSIWKEELLEVEEFLRKAAKRGVKMAIVLYGAAKIDFGVVYEHSLEEILLREMGERRLSLAADNQIVLLAHFSNSGDSFGTWSYNRGMVNLAIDYITHDIISLKLVKQFEPQMDSIYGKKWQRLRNVMVREPKPIRVQPLR
jgi:sugar-specific transcriptional regulator TrmB